MPQTLVTLYALVLQLPSALNNYVLDNSLELSLPHVEGCLEEYPLRVILFFFESKLRFL